MGGRLDSFFFPFIFSFLFVMEPESRQSSFPLFYSFLLDEQYSNMKLNRKIEIPKRFTKNRIKQSILLLFKSVFSANGIDLDEIRANPEHQSSYQAIQKAIQIIPLLLDIEISGLAQTIGDYLVKNATQLMHL